MMRPKRLLYLLFFGLLALSLLGFLGILGGYYYLQPQLPSVVALKDVQFQVPLRVLTKEGELIAEYGDKKRIPLTYEQCPESLVNAFLAAEDDRFFEHPGVDYQGILRAAALFLTTGEKLQGGSTITMQTARNFLLTSEKTIIRKAKEIILSLQMEREFSKEEILELYLNKIYLGQRSYGVGAAAQVYYGKNVDELSTAEIAMIAGLPKAPSAYNPIVNPSRALLRRNYVLRRMHELHFVDDNTYQEAVQAPITAAIHNQPIKVEAPYVGEMVRAEMVARYGADAYNNGYKVYTSIDGHLQAAANRALRTALLDYDRRHGYRGAEGHVDLPEQAGEESLQKILKDYYPFGGLPAAIVTAIGEQSVQVFSNHAYLTLDWEALAWARPYINENRVGDMPKSASDILKVGDIIRIQPQADDNWSLAEIPEVSGALVSLNPQDGALYALVGGFDYYHSKFNRVTQAERQPGSNLKPFVYSAALDNGFTLASMINDAPVVFDDAELEGEWRPENYSGKFYGPTRLREALVRSRNLVSIRILRAIGIKTAIDHVAAFGFDPAKLPRDLSLALGSASIKPYELVRGYAVLANGGYLVEPYFIQRIEAMDGTTLFEANPLVICPDDACTTTPGEITGEQPTVPTPEGEAIVAPMIRPAPRTVSAQNIYLITSILQDVIRRGTGVKARSLGRGDIAGKTGTTNDQRDAWFSGFNPDVVTTAWIGFDTPHPLGRGETGSRAALPMWIDYMRDALKGRPEKPLQEPAGMITVRIDPDTGEYTGIDNEKAIFEIFRTENAPQPPVTITTSTPAEVSGEQDDKPLTGQLF